jgi:hypothetical protein
MSIEGFCKCLVQGCVVLEIHPIEFSEIDDGRTHGFSLPVDPFGSPVIISAPQLTEGTGVHPDPPGILRRDGEFQILSTRKMNVDGFGENIAFGFPEKD